MNIQRKILFLVLGIGALCFLLLGGLSFFGMIRMQNVTDEKGNEILRTYDKFADDYGDRLVRDWLQGQANLVSIQMSQRFEFLDDVNNIARTAEKILEHPEEYSPEYLTEPKERTIVANKSYIYYNPGVREQLATNPALAERFALLSNIKDSLEFLSLYYQEGSVCYLATEDGIFIRADAAADGKTTSLYDEASFNRSYDFRERPWYIVGKQTEKNALTDVYESTAGNLEVSSVVPFYDHGKFAGVAGVTMTLESIHDYIKANDGEIYFVMDSDGQIAISSQEKGILSVKDSFFDLRKVPQEDLAGVAREMTEGKSGTTTVLIDGTEYYIAYLPIPNINYSCAALANKKMALAPMNITQETVKDISEGFAASVDALFRETIFYMSVLFVLIFAVLIVLSKKVTRKFARPILELTEGMKKIAKGDLNTHLSIKTGDEIETLAESVNAMTADLKSYIEDLKSSTAEKERLAANMVIAEHDRFVNKMLMYSMSGKNPNATIQQMLKYLGNEYNAERTYIFEELNGGIFANTYEWCAEGITSEMANLKCLPYDGMVDVWYDEYKKSGNVIIYDLEEYRAVSESMYNVLKPQGITSLVTAPLALDGEYIGFFGVDNPPQEKISDIAETLQLLAYFLSTVVRQKQHLAQENERIEKELNSARQIQAGMLPNIFPDRKEVALYATMDPAKEVGGDFYDFYMIDQQRLVVTIADVSGKGIPASLFMVISKTILKNCAITIAHEAGENPVDWSKVIEQANVELCENNEEDMFVTVFFGVLDLKSGDFAYVNAGHNPPLICRDGKFEYLRMDKKSNMLGLFDFETYHEYHLTFAPGDMLFLYTDGVTEAMNENEEIYSEERLQETLNAQGRKPVKELLAAVRKDVDEYAGRAEQSDDITMLGLMYQGKEDIDT